ncbi:hypothetical protein OsJ_03125 [Oryza sativa Japonica Group]|uniref:Uncharacterized protein n=1 Tax=Oryza sativa subsp. japonica TaxID=39947 RepID=B9EYZ9_ORYSJ|nr:hypothetical protein OsJ_03125 [Oryza sativa Japonica Group]
MSQLGDPATRPEEDTCFIPTSYAIDEELREWSETAVVSWAAHAPPTTEPRDVEQAFLDEFKLRRGEVAVSLHHPQAFLIKFQHRQHCEEALAKGYVKRHGIEIHFIKWRSLESALGVALMFRVRLCLDGVPMHAWAADIAERIIGRTCALEQIETDVVHPVESGNTRSIDLWAWTANPSTIPKRMWLGFTKRAKDPNLGAPICGGEPTGALAEGVAPSARGGRLHDEGDHDDEDDWDGERDDRDGRADRDGRHARDQGGRGGRGRRRGSGNDHPRPWRRNDRDDDRDDRGRDLDRGRDDRRGSDNDYRRERTRSPRRRDRGGANRSGGGTRRTADPVYDSSKLMNIPLLHKSANQAEVGEFRLLHALHNSSFLYQEPQTNALSPVSQLQRLSIIADKAATPALSGRPAKPRIEAWFQNAAWEPIPVEHAFARIKSALPPPTSTTTCQQVEEALLRIELAAAATDPPWGKGGHLMLPPSPPAVQVVPTGAMEIDDIVAPPPPSPVATQLAQAAASASPISTGVLDALFASPPQPIIASPPRSPPRSPCARPLHMGRRLKIRTRQHSQPTRRSERIAKQPARPTMERCQRVLFKRLGLNGEEGASIEQVIAEYVAMFDGPLPAHVIAALTTIFGIDDEEQETMDAALISLVGEGIADAVEDAEDTVAA